MSMKVPNSLELEVINAILDDAMTLRIYGNNKTPASSDVASNYTEIAGGGYAAKALTPASWTITSGDPTNGTYATQTWNFTGTINAPGTIYGYYVTRNSDGKLMWAERFPSANVPFSPVNGSRVAVLPKFNVESLF